MPDLREMTALELLAIEARRQVQGRSVGAAALLAFERAGISDLDVIYRKRANADPLGGIFELTDGGKRVEPPLTERDLMVLPQVGAPVYAQDRDNVEEWAAVARLWDAHRKEFKSHWVSSIAPRKVTTSFLAAGHGPSYARKIVESAIQHGVSPLAYGFDVTAAEWAMLASAGVADRAALAGYEAAGCTMTEAVDMAAKGVPPGAAVLLHRDGVPMAEWVDRAAGIPENWVPYGTVTDSGFHDERTRQRDPVTDGVLGAGTGHTLADLKRYADAGWTNRSYDFHNKGVSFGHGRRSRDHLTLTPTLCHRLVDAGITPADLARWAEAVTMSSQGYRGDADYVPSLSGRRSWSADMLDDVLALHAAGVRPSHATPTSRSG
jgi:hypothetical protein